MRAFAIAWKDTMQRLRDPQALILNLAGPLVLLYILGGVFGQPALPPTPTIVVNQDEGELGAVYVDVLTATETQTYVNATVGDDVAAARAAVDSGDVATAVIVPVGFSNSIFQGQPQQVEVYTDPGQEIGASIVRSIVESINARFTQNTIVVQTTLNGLVETDRITPDQQTQLGQEIGAQFQADPASAGSITLATEAVQISSRNPAVAYYAPAMLLFFLMLNAVRSGPHLLEEQRKGTLTRLYTMPMSRTTIVTGKLLGDLLMSFAQALVLVLGMMLIFRVNFGNTLGVLLLLLGMIMSTTALGLAIAGLIRSPDAVGGATQATALVFGLIGGAFIPMENVPGLNILRMIAPNHWALEGFLDLASGGGVSDIALPLIVLFAMTAVFLLIAGMLLNRKLRIA